MPASPPVVDQLDAPEPTRRRPPRRRRRLHGTDLLVLGVVAGLVGGFAWARRLGLAPVQPVPNLPTTTQVAAVPLPAPAHGSAGVVAPPTTVAVARDPGERLSLDRLDPYAFGGRLPTSHAAVPFAVRPADPQRPVGVLVAGDALAGGLGRALARAGAADGTLIVRSQAVAASGLARPDVFDWANRIGSVVVPDDEVVVLFLGLNDAQGLSRSATATGPVGSPSWTEAYRARLAATIDGAGPRPVVVVGLPAVENPVRDRELQAVRRAVAAEVAAHANVRYVDLNAVVSDGGRFARYLDGGDGTQIAARSNDGEQFTDAGYDLVAAVVRAAVWPPPAGDGAAAG